MSDITEPQLIDFNFKVEITGQNTEGRFYFLPSQSPQDLNQRAFIATLISSFPILGSEDPIKTEISHWNNPAILLRERNFRHPTISIPLFHEASGLAYDRDPYNPFFFQLFPHLLVFQYRNTLTPIGKRKDIIDRSGIALVCGDGVFENSKNPTLLRTYPLFYLERQMREGLPHPSKIFYVVQETFGGSRNGYNFEVTNGSVIDTMKRDGIICLSTTRHILPRVMLKVFRETWLFMYMNKLGGDVIIPKKLSDY